MQTVRIYDINIFNTHYISYIFYSSIFSKHYFESIRILQ